MENLFVEWESRENINNTTDSTTKNSDIDKNSKMLLKSILITHKKYMKEKIPSEYVYDEEIQDFKKVDVTKEITPFTTEKDDLFTRLESEREDYLSKKENNKNTQDA
tara:strand:+ start:222 stop:542 length:321 start_codon:yes stop_codon:yes gene_type:complete